MRDSAAIIRLLHWLESAIHAGTEVTEKAAAEKVAEFRSHLKDFVGLSFESISAADEHAALPHYHTTTESEKKQVKKNSVYLLDSGGQYLYAILFPNKLFTIFWC